MDTSFRLLASVSFSTLVGIVMLSSRLILSNRASAEPFQPIKEAEMPRQFPGYTPVDEIELKSYPAYRKASASGKGAFWTLFKHIQRNNIRMTAPVEMDYGDPSAERTLQRSMSFLYETPKQGSPGKQQNVEVADVHPMTVVSIGCRGQQTAAVIAEARRKLLEYLVQEKHQYVVSGPMRVMGYNSPFVPRDRNFFEVQIPVKILKTVGVQPDEGAQKTAIR